MASTLDRKGRLRRGILAAALLPLAAGAVAYAAPKPKTVKIRAKRFVFTPKEVRLKKGEPVVFELTTEDIFMGMNIPDFKVRSDIVPGKTMKLAFTPDKAGTFTFVCDVFCGDGHEAMSGTLVVA
jgi:cytochrome c oxidase subunit 2